MASHIYTVEVVIACLQEVVVRVFFFFAIDI
jgi:hypothetical protein